MPIWAILREAAEARTLTERKFQETDLRFRETDLSLKRVGDKIDRLGSRLGDFVEDAVRPGRCVCSASAESKCTKFTGT